MPRVNSYMPNFKTIDILIVSSLFAGCSIMQDSRNSENSLHTIPKKSLSTSEVSRENNGNDPTLFASAKLPLAEGEKDQTADVGVSKRNPEQIHADIWRRMRTGFQLSHEADRKRVQAELKWFVNNPKYVERVIKRASPHLHYIVEELEKHKLPLEFALLPIIESAYDPFAYSHSRAAGLWQFIPGTARVYGLQIDWWYDGRRAVRASTKAAIDYLTYLHNLMDKDWLLALAAYNAGQGNVIASIRSSGLEKNQIDFWSLKIFRETHSYVPRLLAISELINNPKRYQIKLPEVANKPYWKVVKTGGQLDLDKAAELAGMTSKEIYLLNAGFNQWTTHPKGPHEIIVPINKASLFREQISRLPPTARFSWKRHAVSSGESLGKIANKYKTTVATIREVNGIIGNVIYPGDSLIIPAASPNYEYALSRTKRLSSIQEVLTERYGGQPIVYIVQSGDSFWDISRKFGIGMRELAKWNGMCISSLLHPGK